MWTVIGGLVGGFITAVLGVVGVIVAARYGWLGKRGENEISAAKEFHSRLCESEKENKSLEESCTELRQELQVLYLLYDLVIQICPEAENETRELRTRIYERRKKFFPENQPLIKPES